MSQSFNMGLCPQCKLTLIHVFGNDGGTTAVCGCGTRTLPEPFTTPMRRSRLTDLAFYGTNTVPEPPKDWQTAPKWPDTEEKEL